ncbi:hypothetical protein GPECTOR_11g184 [Gonium pectorale]|uniref:Uncharacterized protein n=1 Tax=Gonium pectorale TaxID=33097 RepID=A0A150GPI1_GONPE|nr:hypothetical protein GPECTOR_11g184 [Gonium pectorale]|eukprot:KXZ51737.1 hypothetical protein GPECTOR_11g184 [Gonium pectorale]
MESSHSFGSSSHSRLGTSIGWSQGTAPSRPVRGAAYAAAPSAKVVRFDPFPHFAPPSRYDADPYEGLPEIPSYLSAGAIAQRIVTCFGADLAWYRVYHYFPNDSDEHKVLAVFMALLQIGILADACYLLVQASQRGHASVVDLAMQVVEQQQAECDWQSLQWQVALKRALGEAVAIGCVELAQRLLDAGAAVDLSCMVGGPDDTDAVYRAASRGHVDMVQWLLATAQVYGPARATV